MANFPSCSHHAIGKEVGPPKNFSSVGIHRSRFEFGALGLVLIISPSSKLIIVYRFFMDSPFIKEHFVKILIFFLTGSTSSQSFSLPKIHWSRSKFRALGLVWSYLSHPTSESHTIFFMDSLFFKKHSVKISKFFSTRSTGWHPVQPIHWVNLYGALILVILEPNSYMA